MSTTPPPIRNVAIIAHVDHGKTTLVDALLSHAGTLSGDAQVCVMDSNPLERERGITILSKNCAVDWRGSKAAPLATPIRINLIDTPGHADFGGEVERVLSMADGCLLLVDAFEGPMPQTRFVLGKALELKLKPIVVVNKCDRPEARPDAVINEVFDLLCVLGANHDALDFPVVYASGRDGWAGRTIDDRNRGVEAVFEAIMERVPAPTDNPDAPMRMLVTTLDYSEYTGRIAIGRVCAGRFRSGQPVGLMRADGRMDRGRALKVLRFDGLGRAAATEIVAGDLCAVEGLGEIEIGDTICDPDRPGALPRVSVDEPTLHMIFRVNDSPFVGREGKFVTSRQLAERLERELRSNVALRVAPGASPEEFLVSGRGLLHLGVLLENMRREGYELAVGRPEVIEREIDGVRCEPIEMLSVDVAETSLGPVMEILGSRGAEIASVDPRGDRMLVNAEIAARSLIGLRSRLLTASAGEAIMHHSFLRYAPVRGGERKRGCGVMVAMEGGLATAYSIQNLSDRGILFVMPQEPVYIGQIVGEHSRENDLSVNVVRAKQLTNFRESNKEATVALRAPRRLTLEAALEYVESDELVEITPQSVRLRKRLLNESDRRRIERAERSRAENVAAR